MHLAIRIAEALEKCLGAYFLFLADLLRPYDPYSELSPLINTRAPDVHGQNRILHRAAFRCVNLVKMSDRYEVDTCAPVYGQLGQDRFRFQIPPVVLQYGLKQATIARGVAREPTQQCALNFNVDWQAPDQIPDHVRERRTETPLECHIFTGSTGHRRKDNAFVESILGYVLFAARNHASDAPYSITVAFRGAQSAGSTTSLILNALVFRTGNPDWVTGVNNTFIPFYQARFSNGKCTLPSGLPTEDHKLIYDWLTNSTRAAQAIEVHEGYRQVFLSCLPGLRQIFTALAMKYRICPHNITMATGHSLGATQTQLFWFAAQDPLFWDYLTSGKLRCTHEDLDKPINPVRAVAFGSPALWKKGYEFPQPNGLYTLAVTGDTIVNMSAYISAYPKGTTYVVLPRSMTYTDARDAERGWGQAAEHPHEPMVIFEAMCDLECLARAQIYGIDKRGALESKKTLLSSWDLPFMAQLQQSIFNIFPPLRFRGRDVRCHYWHIFSHWRRDLSWNAMRPHMTDEGQEFFKLYYLGLRRRIDIFAIARLVWDSIQSSPELIQLSPQLNADHPVQKILDFFHYFANGPKEDDIDMVIDNVMPHLVAAIPWVTNTETPLPPLIRHTTLEYLHLLLFLIHFCQLKDVHPAVYATTAKLPV